MKDNWIMDLIRKVPELQKEKRRKWEQSNKKKVEIYKELQRRYQSDDWRE